MHQKYLVWDIRTYPLQASIKGSLLGLLDMANAVKKANAVIYYTT